VPDLIEAKYSADQLRSMLDKGQAIKNDDGDPSYPIGDAEDLGKAIKAVGRGGGSHDKIRAYIVRRAKALGKSDMIPDDWSSTGATQESTQPQTFTELVPLSESAVEGKGRRRRIQLIAPGWSKNGRYYGRAVLAEAAKRGIFRAGKAMYIDHPTATEKVDRPERSLKDKAAELTADATVGAGGGLFSEALLWVPWREFLNEHANSIGVSIRALGTSEWGEAEGREGEIVTEIAECRSVDFVTEAAAGGRILELLESVRAGDLDEARNIGGWLESRLHLAFTSMADDMYGEGRLTREERIALSSAVGDALDAFVKRVEADQPQLYTRDLWQSPGDGQVDEATKPDPADGDTKLASPFKAKPKSGDAFEGEEPGAKTKAEKKTGKTDPPRQVTENAPGSPPADNPSQEEGSMPELTEEQARELTEARDKAEAERQAALTEAAAARAEADTARKETARLRAAETARPIAVRMVTEADMPAAARVRVLDEALKDVPLTEGNTLDEAGFRARVDQLVQSEAAYLASLSEATGAGQVRGLGESMSAGDAGDREQASLIESDLVKVYERRGMTPEAAKRAAAGRL
jgi:hypothetical protein